MKVFQILGQSVSISDEREAYNRYRLMFQAAADKAERQFYDLYQQNKSLDQVIKNVPNQAKKCIQPAIELSIKILMQHHVLSIDAAQFEEQYAGIHNFWGEPYAEVYDQYAEIVLDQRTLDEYRVQRRQSRSRWAGGGFGVSGALKGAATAGVLNMMSGAGHMAFNGVGKIISSISANSQKNKIYSDPETYSNIALGIWNAVFSLHIALIECLRFTEADPLPFAGAIDEEDVRHAEAILNNAHLTQTIEQCRAAMIESFRLNPYQEDWYRFALKQFGDSDGMLEEIEQYFGFSVVRDEKEKQLNDFAHSLPLDTEELAVSALQKVEQKKEILHYSGDTDQTKIIRDTVDRFDLEYRTVDGITLSTRQEAEAARLELSEIEEIEGQIDHQSLSSIAESEHKISNFSSPVAKAHQEMLHQEWTDLGNR